MDFTNPAFWIAVLQIVAIDVVLGGDNAVVIGLACRRLPEHQRKLGILWGMVGAIGLRLILIFFAVTLLAGSLPKAGRRFAAAVDRRQVAAPGA